MASANFQRCSRATSQSGSDSLDERGIGRERASDHLAQRLLAESGGGRIDGREPVRQRRARRHDMELRMDDLEAEVTVAHVAEHAHALSRRERLLLVRIEVEEAQHELRARATIGILVFEQAYELASRPVMDVGLDDRAFRLLRDARDSAPRVARSACGPRSATADAGRDPARGRGRAVPADRGRCATARARPLRISPGGLRGRDQVRDCRATAGGPRGVVLGDLGTEGIVARPAPIIVGFRDFAHAPRGAGRARDVRGLARLAVATLSRHAPGCPALGKNSCSPPILYSAIAFCPAGEITQSMNACPRSFLTVGCLAGLTSITPYWL